MAFNFDWYAATVLGVTDVDRVASRILHGSGALGLRAAGGRYNYPTSYLGEFPGGGSIQIFYGKNRDVFVVATSGAAPHVAAVLREVWPVHAVSRADVAFDVDEPGVFDRLWPQISALRFSRPGRPIASNQVGDWEDGIRGRTYYAGAFSSAFLVRCYEKGLEQASKHPDQKFSPDWCRVEAQNRPAKKADKLAAASATPEELFAWTPFGAAVIKLIADLELTAHSPARVEATDPEYWLARQYSAILNRWLALPDHELRVIMMATLKRALSDPQPTERATAGPEDLPAPF